MLIDQEIDTIIQTGAARDRLEVVEAAQAAENFKEPKHAG